MYRGPCTGHPICMGEAKHNSVPDRFDRSYPHVSYELTPSLILTPSASKLVLTCPWTGSRCQTIIQYHAFVFSWYVQWYTIYMGESAVIDHKYRNVYPGLQWSIIQYDSQWPIHKLRVWQDFPMNTDWWKWSGDSFMKRSRTPCVTISWNCVGPLRWWQASITRTWG